MKPDGSVSDPPSRRKPRSLWRFVGPNGDNPHLVQVPPDEAGDPPAALPRAQIPEGHPAPGPGRLSDC